MKLDDKPTHLTYCTNVHPGERWDEVERNVLPQVRAVQARVCPDRPFGVGLRLSDAAARELAEPSARARLLAALREHDQYVFTLNGFPYGQFHGEPVKTGVYRPDWLEPERSAYTKRLASLLAELLPADMHGSISTVPVGFVERLPKSEVAVAARALVDVAAFLWQLRQDTGKRITLALEPEPWCLLETTSDAVALFESHLFATAAREQLAKATGLAPAHAEAALRDHLGVCLDACHAAVGHEDPTASLQALQSRGIELAKLQISAGLSISPMRREHVEALRAFADEVYLHQVVVRTARGAYRRHLDLNEALHAFAASSDDGPQDWRIHFHVPVFTDVLGLFGSTQPFLADLLREVRERQMTQHLEVETYTWSVLPAEHRTSPIDIAIARELQWAERTWRA